MEVIQTDTLVVDIAAVGQRVGGDEAGCQRSIIAVHGHGCGAVGGVVIVHQPGAAAVGDADDIPLEVGQIIVSAALPGHGLGIAAGIVAKGHRFPVEGHLGQLAAVVHIAVGLAAVGPAGAHPVGVVGVSPGGAVAGHACQLPSVLPGIGPGAVGGEIADGVVAQGLAVISGEQVAPLAVAVGGGVSKSSPTRGTFRQDREPSPVLLCGFVQLSSISNSIESPYFTRSSNVVNGPKTSSLVVSIR